MDLAGDAESQCSFSAVEIRNWVTALPLTVLNVIHLYPLLLPVIDGDFLFVFQKTIEVTLWRYFCHSGAPLSLLQYQSN